MKYDYATIYNKSAAFYHAHPKAKLALKLANACLSVLFVVSYPLLVFFALSLPMHFNGVNGMLSILFPPALTLLVVSVLRVWFQRPRPYSSEGAGIQPLIKKRSADNRSFPSRHLACAAVIAMAYLHFYPIIGGFLLAISVLLGYTRFALGLHYPSDLLKAFDLFLIFCLNTIHTVHPQQFAKNQCP